MVSSIGVDFKTKDIIVNNKKVKLQLWDTAGHERFRTITTSYYRGAHGIATVFDLTDRQSFEHVEKWLEEINKYAKENVMRFLIGNKSDLVDKRQVTYEEVRALANRLNISRHFLLHIYLFVLTNYQYVQMKLSKINQILLL